MIDPRLWKLLGEGDNHLIFRREDFERPEKSRAFKLLDSSGQVQLQTLAAHVRSLLSLPLQQIPALDGVPVPSASRSPSTSSVSKPDWLNDHVSQETRTTASQRTDPREKPADVQTHAAADWLFDHLLPRTPSKPIFTQINVVGDRWVLLIIATLGAVVLTILSFSVVPTYVPAVAASSIPTIICGYLLLRFRRLDLTRQKKLLSREIAITSRTIKGVKKSLYSVQKENSRTIQPLKELDQRYRSIPDRVNKEIGAIQSHLDVQLRDFDRRRQALSAKEATEFRKVEANFGNQLNDLVRQRRSLHEQEQREITSLLTTLQDRHIQEELTGATLQYADIPGIGEKLKDRLNAAGIYSAADIDRRVYRVMGIGAAKAASLHAWRNQVYQAAIHSRPMSVGSADVSRVRARFSGLRQAQDSRIQQVNDTIAAEKAAIRRSFGGYMDEINREEQAARILAQAQGQKARTELENERIAIQREFQALKTTIESERKKLDQQCQELNVSLYQAQMKSYQLVSQFERYKSVSLLSFLLRVLGTRRA